MRIRGYFTGTVSKEPKLIQNPGKAAFLAFMLESKDAADKFPTRLKCLTYADKSPALSVGAAVFVDGDVSAEAYIPKDGGDPKAVVKLFANTVSVVGGSVPQQEVQRTVAEAAKARTSVPPAGSPVDQDIPF